MKILDLIRFLQSTFPFILLLNISMAFSDGRSSPVPSSFEVESDQQGSPQGWTFQGPNEAASEAWSTEDPFSGVQCLRIDASQGTQWWESDPIRVDFQKAAYLQWAANFWGEKKWRFRSTFCGVEVSYLDESSAPIGSQRLHTECWQTLGWRPAWLKLEVPPEAESVRVRFGIETNESLPGGFDIDQVDVSLQPKSKPEHDEKRLLTCHIRDENGNPVHSRVAVRKFHEESDSDEKPSYAPPYRAVTFVHSQGSFHPGEEGFFQVELSPGEYELTVLKGFEYQPAQLSLSMRQTDEEETITLKRKWNWGERGWRCGDHQIHLHRHGGSLYPFLGWKDVLASAMCEGLDFVPFMGRDHYPDTVFGKVDRKGDAPLSYELTDEITDDFWGHVCPIGVPSGVRTDPRFDEGPMNIDRGEAISAYGGVLSYAHPYGPFDLETDDLSPLSDLRSGLICREFPIDLALGIKCGIDLLTMEGNENRLERKLRDLHRLYNLGFRPTLAASTDFHLEQARQPPGAVRTYVHSEKPSMESVAAAYREGRTFVTNGPLVDLLVEGRRPGEEIRLESGQSLEVVLEARSLDRLAKAALLLNGKAAETFSETEPGVISGECTVPITESSWIAVKVVGPDSPFFISHLENRYLGEGQIAHTSPVYVIVGDEPIRSADPEDAEYFVDWCGHVLAAWEEQMKFFPAEAVHDPVVRERIERAILTYQRLAKELD